MTKNSKLLCFLNYCLESYGQDTIKYVLSSANKDTLSSQSTHLILCPLKVGRVMFNQGQGFAITLSTSQPSVFVPSLIANILQKLVFSPCIKVRLHSLNENRFNLCKERLHRLKNQTYLQIHIFSLSREKNTKR